MYYLDRLAEWFRALGWKRKALVAAVAGVAFGVGSAAGGPLLPGMVFALLLVDFVTDDLLGVHD